VSRSSATKKTAQVETCAARFKISDVYQLRNCYSSLQQSQAAGAPPLQQHDSQSQSSLLHEQLHDSHEQTGPQQQTGSAADSGDALTAE